METELLTKFAVQMQQLASSVQNIAQENKAINKTLSENQKVRIENLQKVLDNQRMLCHGVRDKYLDEIRKNTIWVRNLIGFISIGILVVSIYFDSFYSPPSVGACPHAQSHNTVHP